MHIPIIILTYQLVDKPKSDIIYGLFTDLEVANTYAHLLKTDYRYTEVTLLLRPIIQE